MDAQARAGIEICDSVIRYAEVERYGSRFRLLRLGACDFDFRILDEFVRGSDPAAIGVVREALQDVFSGSIATLLHFALHPQVATTFFTSVPAGLQADERQERFVREWQLLTGEPSAGGVELHATGLGVKRDGGDAGFSVLAMPVSLRDNLSHVLREAPQAVHGVKLSTYGAALVMVHLRRMPGRMEDRTKPVSIGIGIYERHAEFTVTVRSEWFFSHHARARTSEDCAFFAASLMDKLEIDQREVGGFYFYGTALPPDCPDVFRSLWDVRVEKLNPLTIVDLDPATLTGDFPSEAYVPCIGAALGDR